MKTLKPNRNNIETYLPIFTGFYGSQWQELDFYGEAEHYGLPDKFDFDHFMNYQLYHETLSKYFCDCVESEMSEWIELIEYQRLNSPKEYNFTNDSIYCIIRPKKTSIKKYIFDYEQEFRRYLSDNLKSRDGFISDHSYEFADWQEMTKNFTAFDKASDKRGFNLGFILSFIAQNEGFDENNVFEDANNEVSPSEFLSKEFYDMINEMESGNGFINKDAVSEAKQNGDHLLNMPEQIQLIKDFVKENYTKANVKELTIDEFSEVETGLCQTLSDFIYISDVIAWQINEIEQNTLCLDL